MALTKLTKPRSRTYPKASLPTGKAGETILVIDGANTYAAYFDGSVWKKGSDDTEIV